MENLIKYYPVDNGDHSLIILEDGTIIGIDCNFRKLAVGSANQEDFDVKKDLMVTVRYRNNNPYVDVFILTHGDMDHCRGYKENFYQGDPSKYAEKHRKAEEIIIDEMWFSPMIAEEHSNNDEDAFQIEAERRLELHRGNSPVKDMPGNRIKIIGYDGNKDYSTLNHLRYIPGTIVRRFNEINQADFSMFVHAPFKETLASAEEDPNKNTNSIVFQARFKKEAPGVGFSTLIFFGGDADYIAWGLILERTMNSRKDETESALDWDLFLAPHHCSWTFFNEHSNKDEPQESSLEVLRYRRKGGKIIASSKKIVDDDSNPPSFLARSEYLKKLENATFFLNTATEPSEKGPLPIIFQITDNGPVRSPNSKIGSAITSAGGTGSAGAIIKHGQLA